jgi:hypothetical protein
MRMPDYAWAMLVLAADMVTTDRPWTHGDDDLASRVRLFAGCWTTMRLDPTANTRDAILRLHRAATTIACTNCTPNSKPGNDNDSDRCGPPVRASHATVGRPRTPVEIPELPVAAVERILATKSAAGTHCQPSNQRAEVRLVGGW